MKPIRKGGRKTLANDDDWATGPSQPLPVTHAGTRRPGYTDLEGISLPRSGLLEPPDAMDSR